VRERVMGEREEWERRSGEVVPVDLLKVKFLKRKGGTLTSMEKVKKENQTEVEQIKIRTNANHLQPLNHSHSLLFHSLRTRS
jgi:hypothetical protein